MEIVIITEGLSLFSAITEMNVRAGWSIAFVFTAGVSIRSVLNQANILPKLLQEIRAEINKLLKSGWALKLIVGILILQAAVLLAIIFIYPIPNDYDSMTYHLARIIYWDQQGNLAHFASHDLRQITFPPFAEYALLNARFLMGSDSVTRLIQWFSMVVAMIGVTEITKKLGGNSLQRAMSALLTASIPMGIMQATTTQNDYVLAAWTVCLVVFGLATLQNISNPWSVGAVGVALGLMMLTKGTGYIYALPFGIWFIYRMLRTFGWQ
ncbi:MAG: glycosyltransferase family 39 protein, partial [candidate division Zixibacteria bacterium]|nr:glycosyltransferase family 39 protein [candidate division Zixibacteria bacterium]